MTRKLQKRRREKKTKEVKGTSVSTWNKGGKQSHGMSREEQNGEDEQGTLVSRKEIIWSGWERTWDVNVGPCVWMHGCVQVGEDGEAGSMETGERVPLGQEQILLAGPQNQI